MGPHLKSSETDTGHTQGRCGGLKFLNKKPPLESGWFQNPFYIARNTTSFPMTQVLLIFLFTFCITAGTDEKRTVTLPQLITVVPLIPEIVLATSSIEGPFFQLLAPTRYRSSLLESVFAIGIPFLRTVLSNTKGLGKEVK